MARENRLSQLFLVRCWNLESACVCCASVFVRAVLDGVDGSLFDADDDDAAEHYMAAVSSNMLEIRRCTQCIYLKHSGILVCFDSSEHHIRVATTRSVFVLSSCRQNKSLGLYETNGPKHQPKLRSLHSLSAYTVVHGSVYRWRCHRGLNTAMGRSRFSYLYVGTPIFRKRILVNGWGFCAAFLGRDPSVRYPSN